MVSFGKDCVVFNASQYPTHAAGSKGKVNHSFFPRFKNPAGIKVINEIIELKTKKSR